MMRTPATTFSVTALSLLALTATGATAQERSAPSGAWGLSFVAAEPVGDLALYFDNGFGGQIDGSWPMSTDGALRLRGDVGLLVYGHERLRYCYSVPYGCRIEADVTTTNSIIYAGIGPEIALRLGALDPYVYATTGLSYFATVSSVSHDWGDDGPGTTNYSDFVMAWKLGGGMRVRLSRGPRPVALDIGVERHRNGVAEFLTRGDIVDEPDGSITMYPNRSEANLTTFRFGLSLGLGGGRD